MNQQLRMDSQYPQRFDVISAKPTSKSQEYFKRVLILFGVFSSFYFLVWLADKTHIGFLPLYLILLASAMYAMCKVYLEWYAVWKFKIEPPKAAKKTWTVDVLTTYCKGEPKEMIINTLEAIQRMTYPHTAYLCDEDNDPELKEVCERLGVIHVTRTIKVDAKAGNINNALRNYATGELCLILDPDHIPHETFLDVVVGHFEDEKIGYVQAVQGYYNQDSTIIARAAAEQTYLFYGPIMIGLNALGSVPAIGANCVFRRTALDSIGGHAPGLTEDMHTAMLLHSKGWKSVYIPTILNRGLVPWNFSGYCKQQLKWSRGTFDLMFHKLPPIFRKLTFNQKIYYLSCGFFYTYGFKVLFDILLPIIALFMVKVPLKVDIIDFYKHFIPFWLMVQFVRFYCQRWIMGEKERGLYLIGSILLKSSWWIAVTGFVYTLIGKKVPYIPTPKENTPETPWVILIPNFTVMAVSAAAVGYGLYQDLNPYSIFMATIVVFNIATLGLGTLMAMQTWIIGTHKALRHHVISKRSRIRVKFYHLRMFLYRKAEGGMAIIFSVTLALFVIFHSFLFQPPKLDEAVEKNYGGLNEHGALAVSAKVRPDSKGVQRFNLDTLNSQNPTFIDSIHRCTANGGIPFVYLRYGRGLIDSMTINKELQPLMTYVRQNSPMIYISLERNNTPEDIYYSNLLAMASAFAANGAGGVAWTWDVKQGSDSLFFSRSKSFVSWQLDNSRHDDKNNLVDPNELPVLFFGDDATKAQRVIVLERSDDHEKGQLAQTRHQVKTVASTSSTKWVRNRKLHSGSKDLFIRGIAYNPGHDWQDDRFNVALTRDKLLKDFTDIKAMGANTIRRYSPGISDYNIFNAADEVGINVLYGFWFDPKIDYLSDKRALTRYRKGVLQKVQNYADEQSVIAWSVGNETWGLLKHYYAEPYLTEVRKAYVDFIESLAKEIRQIDTSRPIFTMAEHTPMLITELNMYHLRAPSIDVYGVNSYYEQDLVQLDSLMQTFFPSKHYLLSEFGPSGYWKGEYNRYDEVGKLIEPGSYEKANLYQTNWSRFVDRASEKNIGGVAFCWQDRFEGTSTWFGLTDLEGRKKPAYYALTEAWTNSPQQFTLPNISIARAEEKTSSGDRLFYAVSSSGHRLSGLKVKWIVYENGTFEKKFETKYSMDNSITLPANVLKENHRVYLYMRDSHGNVVTASLNLF